MEQATFYDQVAVHYRKLCERRLNYINAVDKIVIDEISLLVPHVKSMLDVGAADGVRGIHIAKLAGVKSLTLLEPSGAMVALINQPKPPQNMKLKVIQGTAENISNFIGKSEKFDVITMLWNVLGHVPDHESRITALVRMKRYLSKKGLLLFDLNNRYNVRAYGKQIVLKNYLTDKNNPSGSFDVNGAFFIKCVQVMKIFKLGDMYLVLARPKI